MDLSSPILPEIQYTGASISPLISIKQDFRKQINYTVTAENGEKKVYTVKASSSLNSITSFKINFEDNEINGIIDNEKKEISLETKGLEQVTQIIPEIEFSKNASISPLPSLAQNFNNPLSYTLTAMNGEQNTYNIIVNNTPLSSEKKILKFDLNIGNNSYEGKIDQQNQTIHIIALETVSAIKPTIEISENASINPSDEEFQDFNNSNSIEYVVTAEDGTENTYTVFTKVYSIFNNGGSKKHFKNSETSISGIGLDLTAVNGKLYIENDLNSYLIEPTENNKFNDQYFIKFNFPNQIITANDYRISYKIDNEIIVSSNFFYDVLSENLPVINAASKTTYQRGDILTLFGENLYTGLYIYAVNGSIYSYGNNHIDINAAKTELTLALDNYQMFPSYYGNSTNHSTKIQILKNGRLGPFIFVEFD
jgi:hypothetical protein